MVHEMVWLWLAQALTWQMNNWIFYGIDHSRIEMGTKASDSAIALGMDSLKIKHVPDTSGFADYNSILNVMSPYIAEQ